MTMRERDVRVRLDGLMSDAQIEIVSDHVLGQLIGQAGDLDRLDRYRDPRKAIAEVATLGRLAFWLNYREILVPDRDGEELIRRNARELDEINEAAETTGGDPPAEHDAMCLANAPERHRLLLELLAGTGLRISEAIGLRRRDLRLDGPAPVVHVRRAIVKERVEPPKSRHSRREVRLPEGLAARFRGHLAAEVGSDPDALVFTNEAGGPLDPNNLRRRVVKPLVAEAGAPWAAFHTFRHTFASMHLAGGTNLLQLSRALGHHSAAFTLSRYTHLLPGEEAPPLDLPEVPDPSPDEKGAGD